MNIYTTLQRGRYHPLYCEDHLFHDNINPHTYVAAVMDGSTMGRDSHLISTLTGKLLRKIVKAKAYADLRSLVNISPEEHLQDTARQLFQELNAIRNQVQLERYELMTTLLLMVIDTKLDKAVILIIGDGAICVNGNISIFNQDNKPDYLGYHLAEHFDSWYQRQYRLTFQNIRDISLSTDGVTSFTPLKPVIAEIDPIRFLLVDHEKAETDEMLNMKCKSLEFQYQMRPTDDVAIVRFIK
ncbi:protein phosphatase 2C domain-containing protein [Chitinophaga rhizophila]|uniref:Protein phosphatase 2C domain-containing protein n=1 Tax=Chitinophaga rhizophila TaxID=2866212 RepID=A0ABS7GB99_9BACT|nr:protein phosphatase 2C domain-containing protein [Chitinophaga rhizophila]MBW8684540.1 protein phosphatase 2C domain-containing protein [Chitinophaga rhizophila]